MKSVSFAGSSVTEASTQHFELVNRFAEAQSAYREKNFELAIRYAEEVQKLVHEQIRLTTHGAVTKPRFSIIVVTCGNCPDFIEALKRLTSYSKQRNFELLILKNGGDVQSELVSGVLPRFRWIDIGFNYGCSGARNVAATHSAGEFLIFLDDDGLIEPQSLEYLISTILEYEAITVRGRVVPKSASGLGADHYDLGNEIQYTWPNAEGISIWRRDEFLKQGGFDPLLSGSEGLALWSKIYRFYGPQGSLYTPNAILHHDFADSVEKITFKQRRYALNEEYLKYRYPGAREIRSTTVEERRRTHVRLSLQLNPRVISRLAPETDLTNQGVSVITTAKNARLFVQDYTQAFKAQTFRNFEIVFVDDDSADGTAEEICHLWKKDKRLLLMRHSGGRCAALNHALAHASHDICAIADVDDISHPRRLEFTLRYLLKHPHSSCVAFATFNEKRMSFTPRVDMHLPIDIGVKTRSLLGMPVSFPTLGFRKSRFVAPFDEHLSAGVDCSWIHCNLNNNPRIDGAILPINQVYYRLHEAQTSSQKRNMQREVALNCVYSTHERLLGPLSAEDKRCARILSGWDKPQVAISKLHNYAIRLIVNNSRTGIYDEAEIERLFLFLVSRTEIEKNRAVLREPPRKYMGFRINTLPAKFKEKIKATLAILTQK